MDRTSIVLCGGDRVAQAVASLPARSSSAPPNHAPSLTEVEGSNSATSPDALTSSNLETLHACEWFGSHAAHGNHGSLDTVSAGDEGFLMFPDHVGNGDHHPNFTGAHGDVLQPSLGESTTISTHMMRKIYSSLTCRSSTCSGVQDADGNRAHSLPCFPAHLATDLSASLLPPFDMRLRDSHFLLNTTVNSRSSDYSPIAGGSSVGLIQPENAGPHGEGPAVRDRSYFQSVANQPWTVSRGLVAQTPPTSSRVSVLYANAIQATTLYPTYFSLDSIDSIKSTRTKRPRPGQDLPQSTAPALRSDKDTLRFQNFDVSVQDGPSAYPFVLGEQGHNPVWGSAAHYSLPSFGIDSRDLYLNELGGHDSLATSGTMSSLGSSQSLGGSTLTSNDAWFDRSGEGLLLGDPEATFSGLYGNEAAGSTGDNHQNGTSSGSSSGQRHCSDGGREAGMQGGSSATPGLSNHFAGVTVGGGRLEEGCIGSKRRVWYRAPNGQFASATQALSGQYNRGGSSSSAGGIRRIRRRRKSEEVERKYRCDFDGCDKAYGTLNHLNTHRATNEHGPRLNAVDYRRAFAEWEHRQLTAHRS